MKPIYFPFTFISEPVFDALSACFGKIVVYQSSKVNIPENMKEWDNSGKLEIRIPIEGDEEKIDNILQDFKTWAQLHQGSELSFLKHKLKKYRFLMKTPYPKSRWISKGKTLRNHHQKNLTGC
jgi:hypothetical protein